MGKIMLFCGDENTRVDRALEYLPQDVLEKIKGKIAITILNGDACRLSQDICRHEEIIILSPWIIPDLKEETDIDVRYYFFCILHEVAHAVCKHSPPNKISNQDEKAQEDEADTLALTWYNAHALRLEISPLTAEDIEKHQVEIQDKRANFGVR